MRVVFVHGACVRDGSWWWHRVEPLLRSAGVSSASPPLPSCGEGEPSRDSGTAFHADVASVRATLEASTERTVVVGHSYGGIVATEAAAGMSCVDHLLYISSYLPLPGESLASFGTDEPAPFLEIDVEVGTLQVRPEALVDTFLHDCPATVATQAMTHLAAQDLTVVGAPVTVATWQQVSSTYLVCTADRGTPVARQRRFAERAHQVLELDTGHHPFLAQPRQVADAVLAL